MTLGASSNRTAKVRDWKYQQDLRNAFKDDGGNFRQDLLDDKGNPDSGKMYQRLMTIGGAPVAEAASKLAETGFQQDRYRNAPAVEGVLRGDPPQPSATNFPPSPNRNAPVVVAPPLNRGGVVRPQAAAPAPGQGGDKPGSLMGFLSNWGVPDELAGSEMNILGGKLSAALGRRIDPNQPLDMNDPNVRGVLSEWVRARRGGAAATAAAPDGRTRVDAPQPQPIAYGGPALPQPSSQAQPQPMSGPAPALPTPQRPASTQAPPSDPTLGGLVPPGYEPGAYVQRLEAVAGSGRVLPDQLRVLQARIEGIRKALEPTPDMKNARAAGMSVKDYLDRGDNANTERTILTNSILPKLDKSQETASAARDEITSIHRARDQLDASGGIFSGTGAPVREKLAKVANFLGVPGADTIENTETFKAAIGQRVLSLVKGLGSGAGISNADRDYAAAMAGGHIELNEGSIRRILDIGEKAARARIDQHNKLTGNTLKSNDAMKDYGDVYRVEQPDAYRQTVQGSSASTQAAPSTRSAGGLQQFSSQTDPRRAGVKSGDIIVDENGRKFRVR